MMHAPKRSNEAQRLQALLDKALLDSDPEIAYDQIVELASSICEAPIALVSLVDAERQWFKARKGLPISETPRSISFCGHAIHEDQIFVVEDAHEDERFFDNPLVLGEPHVRFYAGAPLKDSDDIAIGTLCVMDHAPRRLSPFQLRALEILAAQVMQLIALHKANLHQKEQLEEVVRLGHLITDQQQQLINNAELAALGKMAAGIAHEVNNPLAVIQGRSVELRRALQQGTFSNERVIKGLEYIENMCLRIGKIIRGLRAFARDATQDPLQDEILERIVDETLDLCAERFRHSHITLRVRGDNSIVIPCRRTQISQVLLNLLNNAYDAVENLNERWVEIEVKRLPTVVQIRVTDSGSGIPWDVASEIMKPFYSTKAVGRGTGLGLSIAKGIIESHNGVLRYDPSHPHTSFVVEIPVKGLNTD